MLTAMGDRHPDHPQLKKAIEFKDRLKQTVDRLSQDRSDPAYANVRGPFARWLAHILDFGF
jgi:hypothetical protein